MMPARSGRAGVGVQRRVERPVRLVALLALAVFVFVGRGVCLLAQRVPPVVSLVRMITRRVQARSGWLGLGERDGRLGR